MRIFKAIAHGRLIVGDATIPVYKLENGIFAIGQLALHRFFTSEKSTGSSRFNLGNSNLSKHLSPKMLNDPEFAVEADIKPIRLFTGAECLQLCRAIILTDNEGKLGKNWLAAPKKVQLLLLSFAELGAEKSLERAIKKNPLTIDDSFEKHLIHLLSYRC